MLTLSNLRSLRHMLEYPRPLLAAVTGIALPRLRDIELRKSEPWLDEALLITKALTRPTVCDLIASGDLKDFDDDPRLFAKDLNYWQSGVRLPFSMAIRLARRFGVRPDDLDASLLDRQVWSILSATERHPEAAGWCAWCQADIAGGEQHRDHCLPHNLYGVRGSTSLIDTPLTEEAPRPAKAGRRGGGATAYGLRSLRIEQGKTQIQMAELMDVNPNHYARIERGELLLTLLRADDLAERLGVTRERIYSHAPTPPSGLEAQ